MAQAPEDAFGIGVVDGFMVGWLASSLQAGPELLNFFDLAAVAEAFVLHDQVRVIFPKSLEHEHEKEFKRAAVDCLEPLLRAGIAHIDAFHPQTIASPDGEAPRRPTRGTSRTRTIDADKDFSGWFIANVVQFYLAERSIVADPIVLPCQATIYQMNRRVRSEHSICDLLSRYRSVRELAQRARSVGTSGYKARFSPLPIAPLALDAMSRARSLEHVWAMIAELWDEYRELRWRKRQLRMLLDDASTTPAVRKREQDKWRRAWGQLAKTWRERCWTSARADTTDGLRTVDSLADQLDGVAIGIDGALEFETNKPLKWARAIWSLWEGYAVRRRLREIHNSLERYWSINDREIYRHVERLLGRQVTAKDHERVVRSEVTERKHLQSAVLIDLFPS